MVFKTAVILCGGKGTRLGAIGKKLPKTLIKIHSKPIIWYIIKILQKNIVCIQGVHEKKITNFELVYKTIKNNIYQLEQNLDLVFKEVTLVINKF